MTFIENLAVPKGSIAVITGANGYIASHIADQFIRHGYKVRGTVRNPKKSAWLVPHFEKKYGVGKFELHVIPDMQVDGAYDEAIKGKCCCGPRTKHQAPRTRPASCMHFRVHRLYVGSSD